MRVASDSGPTAETRHVATLRAAERSASRLNIPQAVELRDALEWLIRVVTGDPPPDDRYPDAMNRVDVLILWRGRLRTMATNAEPQSRPVINSRIDAATWALTHIGALTE